jgi:DNA-binding GntR family transcriptional regulator
MAEAERAHDGYVLSELDREFHLTIFRTAELATLEPILTRCALHLHRYTFGNGPKGVTPDNRPGLPSTVEQHRAVRDALRRARSRDRRADDAGSHRDDHRLLVAPVARSGARAPASR